MEAKFRKLKNGEWRVVVDEKVDVDGGHGVIAVNMRDGSIKQVQLTRQFSREDGMYLYIPAQDKRPIARPIVARHQQDRYESKSVRGVCDDCVFSEDAGDGRGCARHRGDPHT